MKKTLLGIVSLLLFTGTASAQTDPGVPVTTGGARPADLGIGVSLNETAADPRIHLLKAIGANYLDLSVGFNFANLSPPGPAPSRSILGLELSAGYRLYKDMSGRIHPYLEPLVEFGSQSDDLAGNPKHVGAGAQFGVDLMLLDQFTLGAAIGGGLDFASRSIGNPRSAFTIFVFTTSINATFWWG